MCIDYRSFCSSHWLEGLQKRDDSIESWTNINLEISARPVYFNEHKADTSLSSVVCPKLTVELNQLDLEVVKSGELCFKTIDSFNVSLFLHSTLPYLDKTNISNVNYICWLFDIYFIKYYF